MAQALLVVYPLPLRVRHIVKRPYHTAQLLIETQRLRISVILFFHLLKFLLHHTKRLFALTISRTMLKHQVKLILSQTHQLRILFPYDKFQTLCFPHALLGYLLVFSVLCFVFVLYQLIQLFILIF